MAEEKEREVRQLSDREKNELLNHHVGNALIIGRLALKRGDPFDGGGSLGL